MISIEMAALSSAILFVLTITICELKKKFSRLAVISLISSLGIGAWAALAALTPPPCLGVSYHEIIQKQMDSGVADIILVKDDDGKQHEVNVNAALGIKVPINGHEYRIARVRYSKSVLGLFFRNRSSKYHLIESD